MAISNNNLIMALTESHLNEDISDAEITIYGFTPYRADRVGIVKKGIIVYINYIINVIIITRCKSDAFLETSFSRKYICLLLFFLRLMSSFPISMGFDV